MLVQCKIALAFLDDKRYLLADGSLHYLMAITVFETSKFNISFAFKHFRGCLGHYRVVLFSNYQQNTFSNRKLSKFIVMTYIYTTQSFAGRMYNL